MRSLSPLRLLAAAATGVVVGLVGTFMHRSVEPFGLILALATVVAAGVFSRAHAGIWGAVTYAVAWVVVVQVLSLEGPGGDILVPAGTPGYVWTYGGLVTAMAALLAPARWFWDDDRGAAEQGADERSADEHGTHADARGQHDGEHDPEHGMRR